MAARLGFLLGNAEHQDAILKGYGDGYVQGGPNANAGYLLFDVLDGGVPHIVKIGHFQRLWQKKYATGIMDPYLVRALEMTPRLAEREIRAAGADFDARPDPDRFSMREVIAHLADWEPIMLTRIKAGVEKPGADILAFDEGQMAVDHNYSDTNPIERIGAWKQLRSETIEYIKGLSEDDFLKAVMHPERGRMLVGDIAHMLVSHDIYHLEQLASMSHERAIDTW